MSETSFCVAKQHKARKQHRCHSCNTLIQTGEIYLRVTGKWPENDGIARFSYHSDCRTTEETLNKELTEYGEDYATISELLDYNPYDVIPLLPDAVAERFSSQIKKIRTRNPDFCPPDILEIIKAGQGNQLAFTALQIRILQHVAANPEKLTAQQVGHDLKLFGRINHHIGRLIAKKTIRISKDGLLCINPEGLLYIQNALPVH